MIRFIRPLEEVPLTCAKLAEHALTFTVKPIYEKRVITDDVSFSVDAPPKRVNDALSGDLNLSYPPLPVEGEVAKLAEELRDIGIDISTKGVMETMDAIVNKYVGCAICDQHIKSCTCVIHPETITFGEWRVSKRDANFILETMLIEDTVAKFVTYCIISPSGNVLSGDRPPSELGRKVMKAIETLKDGHNG